MSVSLARLVITSSPECCPPVPGLRPQVPGSGACGLGQAVPASLALLCSKLELPFSDLISVNTSPHPDNHHDTLSGSGTKLNLLSPDFQTEFLQSYYLNFIISPKFGQGLDFRMVEWRYNQITSFLISCFSYNIQKIIGSMGSI